MNQRAVIVLKDKESGLLVPMAGIWIDNDSGRESAKRVEKKDDGVIAVDAVINEII